MDTNEPPREWKYNSKGLRLMPMEEMTNRLLKLAVSLDYEIPPGRLALYVEHFAEFGGAKFAEGVKLNRYERFPSIAEIERTISAKMG